MKAKGTIAVIIAVLLTVFIEFMLARLASRLVKMHGDAEEKKPIEKLLGIITRAMAAAPLLMAVLLAILRANKII